jgi:hypothetical protein
VTPLEAARRIAEVEAPEHEGVCVLCQRIRQGPLRRGHALDCPWTALPAIVGALEAAEALTAVWKDDSRLYDDVGCSPARRLGRLLPVFRGLDRLVAVLKGAPHD